MAAAAAAIAAAAAVKTVVATSEVVAEKSETITKITTFGSYWGGEGVAVAKEIMSAEPEVTEFVDYVAGPVAVLG